MSELYDQAEAEPDNSGASGRGRSRWLVGLLATGVLLLVMAGVAGAWFQTQLNPPGRPGDPVTVVIPEGSSVARIAAILDEKGVIQNARAFRLYVRLKGAGSFKAGEYSFRENESAADVVKALSNGPEYVFRGSKITIPEGFTLKQIAARVGNVPGMTTERFLQLAEGGTIRSRYQPDGSNNLEGLMYPETYLIEEGQDEADLLRRMVELFDAKAEAAGIDEAPTKVGLSPYEAIVAASLIERETRFDEERAKVSRVIHNRLAKKMRLEIDATVVYALGGDKTRVLLKDLQVDSPYNTYKIPGLPPTPIASPSSASLDAAVSPIDGPWLFYVVTEPDGRHSFGTTFQEHQANIRLAEKRGLR